MTYRFDPEHVLLRAEARAKVELDAARLRLTERARGVLDLPALVRRHPYASLATGAAVGLLLLGPAKKVGRHARGAAGALRRLLTLLVPFLFRTITNAISPG